MKKKLHELIKNWLDMIFLIPGMAFMALGVFLIYIPAGFISVGMCLTALAFFIAKKSAVGR